jgi:hypothetical protein
MHEILARWGICLQPQFAKPPIEGAEKDLICPSTAMGAPEGQPWWRKELNEDS